MLSLVSSHGSSCSPARSVLISTSASPAIPQHNREEWRRQALQSASAQKQSLRLILLSCVHCIFYSISRIAESLFHLFAVERDDWRILSHHKSWSTHRLWRLMSASFSSALTSELRQELRSSKPLSPLRRIQRTLLQWCAEGMRAPRSGSCGSEIRLFSTGMPTRPGTARFSQPPLEGRQTETRWN